VRLIPLYPQIVSPKSELNQQQAVAMSWLVGSHLGNEFGLGSVLNIYLEEVAAANDQNRSFC